MILEVTVPVDEIWERMHKEHARKAGGFNMAMAFAPPHLCIYQFPIESPEEAEGIKFFFREAYKESKYKGSCNFSIIND